MRSHAKPAPAAIAAISARGVTRKATGRKRNGSKRGANLETCCGPAALGRVGQVGDELVELGVCLRRHRALEPCLELVVVQTSFHVALSQDLADRVALLVAHTHRAVARTVKRIAGHFDNSFGSDSSTIYREQSPVKRTQG